MASLTDIHILRLKSTIFSPTSYVKNLILFKTIIILFKSS
ncbi:hypothetical protein B4064_2993 [Caldibacillus thermoamylovorans]|nr:hypothetical protein B4064_2993 [Caldibacillus thermoamylovorans]